MPKRKSVQEDSGSEYDEEPLDSESDYAPEEEEDVKPKKRAPPKKKTPARTPAKKKAVVVDDDDDSGGSDVKPSAKKKASKPKKLTTVTPLGDGWTAQPPGFLYKLNPAAQGGSKIAAFDLDGTLIGTKSGREFATGPDDWKWYSKEVVKKLQELHAEGYQLAFFSNQGGIKGALNGKASDNVRGKVDGMLEALEKKAPGVQAQVFMATMKDDYRKPGTMMWEWFVANANAGVQPDLGQSFYCGDAAGRPTDISGGASSDKDFAAAVGLTFHVPEDMFGEGDIKKQVTVGESSGKNTAMATAFRQLADLLKAEPFKANAFKKVADIIDSFPDTITSAKQLSTVKGVGKSSAAKITEFLEKGTLGALQEAGIEVGAAAPVDKEGEVALKFL